MNWYYSDGLTQAGPISEAELVELRRAGTVTADTLVWCEGLANWSRYHEVGPAVDLDAPVPAPGSRPVVAASPLPPLSSDMAACAECGQYFRKEDMIPHRQAYVCASCKPAFVQKLAEGVAIRPSTASISYVSEEQLLARDYQVDIGRSFSRALEVFKTNAGSAIVVVLVLGAIMFGGGLISNLFAVVVPLGNMLLPLLYTAPMFGGVLWYFIRLNRNEPASLGDAFAGFSSRYGRLLVYGVIETLMTYVFLVPAFITGMGFVFLGTGQPGELSPAMLPMFGLAMLFFLMGVAYVSTSLSFASQLIMDKRYAFWPAIRLSFRMVHRRWWMTFGFMFVGGLVLAAGALICGVGLLASVPIYYGMRSHLYEDNFRDLMPQS